MKAVNVSGHWAESSPESRCLAVIASHEAVLVHRCPKILPTCSCRRTTLRLQSLYSCHDSKHGRKTDMSLVCCEMHVAQVHTKTTHPFYEADQENPLAPRKLAEIPGTRSRVGGPRR